ncbi:MAG: DNA-directed RNA polymerase subunit omega [Myxococcales bacterium]|nr:DNA-directed RNA polymerase subunit omega [Myxococcales bacterium]MCA9697858.1 DNA-directed RNA polymerase subunit omega [Myxococcales bacterium]
MARVTVEDCLDQVPNRFALTVLASRRARALSEGKGTAQVPSDNKVGVVALREIAKGVVRYSEDVEQTILAFIDEQRAQLLAFSGNDATFIDAATFSASEDEEDDEEDDDVKELSSDPDKLQDDEEDDEEEEAEAEEPEEEEADGEAISGDDDDDSISDDDVDPSVLEDLDDLDEEDGDDDEEEEPEAEED